MSISNNTIITSAGLDLATSAHDSGPLIAIKYFVPSYDYRIDPNMYTDSIDVLELSASMSADDTEPYGEIIYNIDADNHIYTLSDSTNFIVSGGTETNHTSYYTVENPLVTDKYKVNLYDGSALSNYYSGTEAVYDSNDYPNAWKITGFDTVSGDNSVPSEVISGNSRFFDVTDYYPVSEDSGYIKGSWKCRLSKNIGNVKFNKIGLYVVQLDSNGNESSAPVLFAEASLSETITKTNFGNDGFDDIVIDVQLQLVSLPADFSDVFYSTSGDYWSRTVGGLYYPDKIGIGTFEDGVEEPDGQLEVKSITKQLTLTYDTDNKVYFNVGINDTSATQLKLTSKSTTNGLLDINFNNKANLTDIHELSVGNLSAKLNSRDIILKNSLVPEATNNLGLGDYGLDFRQIYSKRLYSTNKSIETNSTLLPKGTIDLGNSASKWNNVYANNINASTSIVTKDLTATNINSDKLTINELTTSSIILKNKTLGYWIVDYFATDSNGLIQATDPKTFCYFSMGMVGFSKLPNQEIKRLDILL